MEAKKISFGFSKITKKLNLLQTKENAKTEPKVELIKCLEGQEIKLVEEKPEEKPLVIYLKESHKTSAALASLMKRRSVLLGEEEAEDNDIPADPFMTLNNEGPEDIEKRAARELLAETQKNGSADPANNLVLPVVKPEDLPLEGAKESTLDDYDSIPIQDFGKAMLRGMGWTEPLPKPNKKCGPPLDDIPVARPKGMGLGADKALNKKNLLVAPEANEVLEIKRNAYVVILGGKHKDLYGKIEGFDDHAGRVIIKMAIGGAKEVFNEFLCQPVSRKEYAQYGKCINSSKYEEFKKKENEYGQTILDKKESDDTFECKKNDDYQRIRKYDDYKEDKKDIKRDIETDGRRPHDKYASKNYRKNEDAERRKEPNSSQHRDHKIESNRDDVRDQRRENDKRNYRNENPQRDHDRNESTSNYTRDHDKYRNSRSCDKSSNRDRDKKRERDRETHPERSDGYQYKKIRLDDPSDSESDSHLSKHKKSKKANLKRKSKKSKKYKSKYKNNSSDTETTTSKMNSSSDSEEGKRKHKKKTKKSKKERERSRSRGRR